LDPFGDHEDHRIWEVLEAVGLKPIIVEFDEKLGMKVHMLFAGVCMCVYARVCVLALHARWIFGLALRLKETDFGTTVVTLLTISGRRQWGQLFAWPASAVLHGTRDAAPVQDSNDGAFSDPL
jgi:hypothetical protein